MTKQCSHRWASSPSTLCWHSSLPHLCPAPVHPQQSPSFHTGSSPCQEQNTFSFPSGTTAGIPIAPPHLTFTVPFTLLQLQLLPGPYPIHLQFSNIFFEGRINLTGFIKLLPQQSVQFCQILTPWKERETTMRSLNNSSPPSLWFSSSLHTDFVLERQ